jgi:hypothetical protein
MSGVGLLIKLGVQTDFPITPSSSRLFRAEKVLCTIHPTTPTTDYTTAMCTHIIHLPYQWQDKTPRLAGESDDAIMHQDKTTAGGQQACGPRLELLRRDKTIDLAALSYRWQAIFWAFFCLRLLSVARLPSDSCTRVFTH